MTDETNPPLEFKIGDYVTENIDSYICRFISGNREYLLLEFVALAGLSNNDKVFSIFKGHRIIYPICFSNTLRVATRKELIDAGVITKSVDFIKED